MKIYLPLIVLFLLNINNPTSVLAQKTSSYTYSVAQQPWQESLGNHRAVLQIDKAAEVVNLDFNWRRPDKEVGKKCFLIINAITGDTIRNINRIIVSNEKCKLQFGPVKENGIYYFYYLPYVVQRGWGGYNKGYIPQEKQPAAEWLNQTNREKWPVAKIIRVESREEFDSFYPMEVIATTAEEDSYKKQNRSELYLFPEDRKNTIRMRKNIPMRWINKKQGDAFTGEAAPNEYYAFQIGLWAGNEDVNKVSYQASPLQCGAETIPATAITCFNVEGTDPYGNFFKKEVNVPQGNVQPLWFGIDIPTGQKAGIYEGRITISDATGKQSTVPVRIRIAGNVLVDRGDSEPWRHSRLRWLNSTLGIADTPTSPYTAMTVNGNQVECLGRTVVIEPQTGLPQQIDSWGTEILEKPVQFIIRTSEGAKNLKATPTTEEKTAGHITQSWKAEDEDLAVSCKTVMEFDGWMNYIYTILPKKDIKVEDIRLEVPVKKEIGTEFMGMGLPGRDTPLEYDGKWDAPEKNVNSSGVSLPTSTKFQWWWPFDSFWIGNAHAGIHCEFRGSTYSGPLLNLYRPAYPESWYNGGKGGFSIRREDKEVKAIAYSGERNMKRGEPITFDFAMIITPVKKLDMKRQFTDRYYHHGKNPTPPEEDVKAGIRIINIHQGNEYNPFINYPFLTTDKIKKFTKEWHQKGCKVKLYYTLRELSNVTPEIWAIRSLGEEILRGGKGGGFPWCREHFVSDYTPQWYEHFEYENNLGVLADAAILTTESDSRWYNYYIEGLAWFIRNLDLDGIYMDDVSFDRRILKRLRRAMENVKPGCLIDLHSNTGFSRGPATQYTEFFPYVDKLWFGESFAYNRMSPANYLVETSGIPFGLTGDMLQNGGNAWLGMQYGMTSRDAWQTEGVICNPRNVWKIWDEFGIADADMSGFWEENPAVTASNDTIKVTSYIKKGDKTLLSIGNYSDEAKTAQLDIDWKQLGLDPKQTKLVAPEIPDFQQKHEWNIDAPIRVEPREGYLIYLIQN